MRTRALLLAAMGGAILFAFACGGDDSTITNPGDGGADGTALKDSAGGDGNVNTDGGQDSGPQNDAGSSDAPIDVSITCTNPTTCSSSTDVCCGTLYTGAGSPPSCPITGVATKCASAASCPTTISFTCSSMEVVRFCNMKSQCTESGYDSCCKFTAADGGSVSFCLSATLGMAGGGTCM